MTTCPACSYQFNPKKKHRSVPQHRLYFGMIRAAFDNWPTQYKFQPIDAEALRMFLQMRAGWGQVIEGSDGKLYIIPMSVAFDKMSPTQFSELCHRVSRIIGEIIGVSGHELLEKSEMVA